MNTLINFMFETRNNEEQRLVNLSLVSIFVIGKLTEKNKSEIEDSFYSYMDSPISEGKDYETNVRDVMDASGFAWGLIKNVVPECKKVFTITI